MAKDRIEIDGETYGWLPEPARHGGVAPGRFRVFWFPDGDATRKVRIGRLHCWGNYGWIVLPRLGTRRRAQEAGMGYADTRKTGVLRLVALARAEAGLTMVDKIRLGIVHDRGDGPVDDTECVEPVPTAPAG